jgi:hypothetical protein
MIYTATYEMLLMRATPLRGQVERGWALKISTLLDPVKWHQAVRRMPFGDQKSRDLTTVFVPSGVVIIRLNLYRVTRILPTQMTTLSLRVKKVTPHAAVYQLKQLLELATISSNQPARS